MTHPLPTFEDVLEAGNRIQNYVIETPVLQSEALNKIAGVDLHIKAECLQETGSFKLRGATNRLLQIPIEDRSAGVVAYSSGNHAQGIARVSKRLGMPAIILMPSDAPQVKVDGVLADGAEVRHYDRNSESREEIAEELARERGAIIVPSYNDAMIVAGQGTCGLEFAKQIELADKSLDHLICCASGGGLIGGIALALEGKSPSTKVWAAEPVEHDDWIRSLKAGEIRPNASGTRSVCDALLIQEPGSITWPIGARLFSGGYAVTDAQVFEAMRLACRHLKVVVEPGGGAALAAALFCLPEDVKGSTVGVVLTGGNVDMDLYTDVLAGRKD